MFARKLNPGLELRPLQPADAPALFAVVEAHRSSLREWLPWVDATKTVADSKAYIEGTVRDDQETRAFTCGIWSMGRLVGVIGHNRDRLGQPRRVSSLLDRARQRGAGHHELSAAVL